MMARLAGLETRKAKKSFDDGVPILAWKNSRSLRTVSGAQFSH
jgi:hypothetical protein